MKPATFQIDEGGTTTLNLCAPEVDPWYQELRVIEFDADKWLRTLGTAARQALKKPRKNEA